MNILKKFGGLGLLLLLGACNFPTRQALNEATLTVGVLQTQVAVEPVQTMTASALQTLGVTPQISTPGAPGAYPTRPTGATIMPFTQVPDRGGVIAQPGIPGQGATPSQNLPTTGMVTVTVTVATNCRTGPAKSYAQLGVLDPGEQAVVVGKNEALDYWIIENPDASGTCWLWGHYANVSGDTGSIPEVPDPNP